MSRSTTSTFSFALKKYSRSYPKTNRGSQPSAPSDAEWQHFVQPELRLTLDITKGSPAGTLEAVKLKIVWDISSGDDMMDSDQPEVALENLDLLAFSYASEMTQSQSVQSPPLKAVYRDAVVGMRYLVQRSSGTGVAPLFRRFQIVFAGEEDALQFVECIRPVCPCQSHGGASIARAPTSLALAQPTSRPATNPASSTTPLESQTSLGRAYTTTTNRPSSDRFSSSQPPSSLDIHATSSSSDPPVPSSSLTFNSSPRPQSANSESLSQHRHREISDLSSLAQPPASSLPTLPPSSQPSGSTMPPPPAPPSAYPEKVVPGLRSGRVESPRASSSDGSSLRDSFVEQLRKGRELYDLSSAELEVLVGQVLREPEFLKLVHTLETIWDAKVFLDGSSTSLGS
ncbi:hypothetical protein K488DRAFT_85825 [Vararia minispora EC-137]|uniref:Uncharacterized protein n=1 Tax=Vararia minispora EC-137 TaxID=1314806 RepID=A0ACB8QKV1_9AGAM|nr:hypothetical protein K488DRAFT_85825 [Vararia minispora EC-137]